VFETFSGKEIEKSWKKSSWAQDTEWAKSEAGFCPQYLRIQAVNLPDHLLIITCRTFRHRLDGPNIPSQVRSTVAVHKFETIFLMPRLFCQIKIYEGREISSKKKEYLNIIPPPLQFLVPCQASHLYQLIDNAYRERSRR
jgi:hypothetical protein